MLCGSLDSPCNSYKGIQEAEKKLADSLDQLLAQLIQLKMDIVDKTLCEQREGFQYLRERNQRS